MKTPFVAAYGCFLLGLSAGAADEGALKFGGEQIGVPPLSLSASVANSVSAPNSNPLDAGLPRNMEGKDAPSISPNLIPRTIPNMMRKLPRQSPQSPNVTRASGMPILIPSDAVDYKMTIIPPDPTIDYKLVIKDPGPAAEKERAHDK
jgi:hypothetical protein